MSGLFDAIANELNGRRDVGWLHCGTPRFPEAEEDMAEMVAALQGHCDDALSEAKLAGIRLGVEAMRNAAVNECDAYSKATDVSRYEPRDLARLLRDQIDALALDPETIAREAE